MISPSFSLRSSATRRAAIRAAMRRGSRTKTCPRTSDSSAGGTRVVLPAPGAASTIRFGVSPSERTMTGSRSSIGRCARSKKGRLLFRLLLLLLGRSGRRRLRLILRIVGYVAVLDHHVTLELLVVFIADGLANPLRNILEVQRVV